jgi:thioredoxin reductase
MTLDVIIVGAGPAGLSAALILGRCRRRVLVIDTGRPRNAASRAMHGFLTRDGINPQQLRQIARDQLAQYDSVAIEHAEATRARCVRGGFEVRLADGRRLRSRRLLLATGVVDFVPQIEGLAPMYGRSVFHCPYCDGWESRDQPLAVYSRTSNGVGLAIELTVWSSDVVLCTDGSARLSDKHRRRLAFHRIPWRPGKIARLEGRKDQLERIVFADGQTLDRRVLFFSTPQRQGSELAAELGCTFTRRGAVSTGEYEATNIPGLYVAGDASRLVQLAIVAAAEGAQAAFAINTSLIKADLK